MEKNLEEPMSSPLAEPKPFASVLQTLFQHLSPTTEQLRHTGVHANPFGSEGDSNGKSTVAKTRDTIFKKQEDGGSDWPVYVEAEACRTASVPVYKPLSALDNELNTEDDRTLRDEPALVPLEAVIGIAQRDPRSVPSAVMVTLPLPHFARSVEWETREPLPLPPQVGVFTQKENPPPHLHRPLQDTSEHFTGSSPTPKNLPTMTTSAVHRLPLPTLAGLIHPTYSKSEGCKSEGRNTEAGESQTKGSVLKGLFSTLLPSSDL
ncbi:hypothetical protein GJAV_G00151590 [Gymnothorax javanicus]|nr:hypothetical protein GJAV_G00151590 [Gymnothorax javanicus]